MQVSDGVDGPTNNIEAGGDSGKPTKVAIDTEYIRCDGNGNLTVKLDKLPRGGISKIRVKFVLNNHYSQLIHVSV